MAFFHLLDHELVVGVLEGALWQGVAIDANPEELGVFQVHEAEVLAQWALKETLWGDELAEVLVFSWALVDYVVWFREELVLPFVMGAHFQVSDKYVRSKESDLVYSILKHLILTVENVPKLLPYLVEYDVWVRGHTYARALTLYLVAEHGDYQVLRSWVLDKSDRYHGNSQVLQTIALAWTCLGDHKRGLPESQGCYSQTNPMLILVVSLTGREEIILQAWAATCHRRLHLLWWDPRAIICHYQNLLLGILPKWSLLRTTGLIVVLRVKLGRAPQAHCELLPTHESYTELQRWAELADSLGNNLLMEFLDAILDEVGNSGDWTVNLVRDTEGVAQPYALELHFHFVRAHTGGNRLRFLLIFAIPLQLLFYVYLSVREFSWDGWSWCRGFLLWFEVVLGEFLDLSHI